MEIQDSRRHILLVEDSPDDIALLRIAFDEIGVPVDIDIVSNGQRAMDFLLKKHPHQSASRPDLILLDINMPVKNGFDFLDEVKGLREFCSIPVVVLTSSTRGEDRETAMAKGANAYISKPMDFDTLVEHIRWFWSEWGKGSFQKGE